MAAPQKKLVKIEETKAVAPAPRTELATQTAPQGQEVVASDVIIPRLLLMQAISPLVTSRKAQIGDLVRSTTNEKLGDPEHPIHIIPLAMTNVWMDFEKVPGDNQPRFRGMYPRGITKRNDQGMPLATNADLPWEFLGPNGETMFRRKTVILYALIPSDIAAYASEIERAIAAGDVPDLNKGISPVVITFQSTSFKHGGKKAASFFQSLIQNNATLGGKMVLQPYDYILPLKCREEKKGTAAWYVFDFDKSIPLKEVFKAPGEAQSIKEKAAFWLQALSKGGVKVDEAGEIDEDSTAHSSPSESEI